MRLKRRKNSTDGWKYMDNICLTGKSKFKAICLVFFRMMKYNESSYRTYEYVYLTFKEANEKCGDECDKNCNM